MTKSFPKTKIFDKEIYTYAGITRRLNSEAKKIKKTLKKEGWKVRIDEQKSQSFNFKVHRLYKRRK